MAPSCNKTINTPSTATIDEIKPEESLEVTTESITEFITKPTESIESTEHAKSTEVEVDQDEIEDADSVSSSSLSVEPTKSDSAETIEGLSYSQALTGTATAYTSEYGALTATGVPAYVGGVAVNPNIIPYGSKLYIETTDGFVYGYATAVDTGGALMDGSALVDLYMSTYDECINFGRRTVNVYVLD